MICNISPFADILCSLRSQWPDDVQKFSRGKKKGVHAGQVENLPQFGCQRANFWAHAEYIYTSVLEVLRAFAP